MGRYRLSANLMWRNSVKRFVRLGTKKMANKEQWSVLWKKSLFLSVASWISELNELLFKFANEICTWISRFCMKFEGTY